MFPKVTVVIPFYNCPYVDEAIQSALDQTYSDVEIIVVDDGSTTYTDKIAPFKDRIRYLRKANGGTASALNHGIRHATGQYIAWLSSDDLFHPDKIVRQLSFMLAQDAWVSHTNYDLVNALNETIESSAGRSYVSRLEFRRAFLKSVPVHGCTVMTKKELFEHVGFFNEHLLYTQDYEMWIRIVLSPFEFHYLQESLTRFRWHGGNGTLLHQAGMEKEVRYIRETYSPLILNLLQKNV
ncbi:glycosyltransferase [Paenibacillus sp. GCM10027628]|uniref:glycosyltransferase n=1 Tax=Paenibacillus sp. GCM10027628 TaxID=3273413 RepID=UPI003642E1C8